jgi:Smr domain
LRHRPFAKARLPKQPEPDTAPFDQLAGPVAPVAAERRAVSQAIATPCVRPPEVDFVVTEVDGRLEGHRQGTRMPPDLASRRPESTLDLHGHDRPAARRALLGFLRTRHDAGDRTVCVIVGKGLHSDGGIPVLRDELGGWLTAPQAAVRVWAFVTAARPNGGDGAVMVALARLGKDRI